MPSFEYQPAQNQWHRITQPCGPDNTNLVQAAWLSLSIGGASGGAQLHVYFSTTDYSQSPPKPSYLQDIEVALVPNVRWQTQVPANTDQIGILIENSDSIIAATLELQAK